MIIRNLSKENQSQIIKRRKKPMNLIPTKSETKKGEKTHL
jgi:hypothetical protein